MQHRWQEISPGEKVPELINVFIEVSKGSIDKYELDKNTDIISVDRTNNNSEPFPFAYGFIPQTLWDDGDQLDVVLLTDTNPLQGEIVEARPVAIMQMTDDGKSDDKIICVPSNEKYLDKKKKFENISDFFNRYKPHNENGERVAVEIQGFKGQTEAFEAIERGIKLYKKTHLAG